jgi:transgelin
VTDPNSRIADPVTEQRVRTWLQQVIGSELSGSLQDALKNGDALCEAMSRIQPGSVPRRYVAPRMAFKQMENIGWFLEAALSYGVSSSDLFVTVDLFEGTNMKQVVICVSALQKLAESRGFKPSR